MAHPVLRRLLSLLVLTAALFVNGAASAAPSDKVALVIAASSYRNSGARALDNPPSDASLVARSLKQSGFEVVSVAEPGISDLQLALKDFAQRARGARVAFIYFAGHGMEADNQNWLLPVDVALASPTDLQFEAVNLETILRTLDGAQIRIVALDACRDNPFMTRTGAGAVRVRRGLMGVEADNAMVLFAAAAGETVSDGIAGSNSPFAVALARRLAETNLDLRIIGGQIRDDVIEATQGTQRPFMSATLVGEQLVLNPAPGSTAGAQVARTPRNLPGTYVVPVADGNATWSVRLLTPQVPLDGRAVAVAAATLTGNGQSQVVVQCEVAAGGEEARRVLTLGDYRFPAPAALGERALVVDSRRIPFENPQVAFQQDRSVVLLVAPLDDERWSGIGPQSTLAVDAGAAKFLPRETAEIVMNVREYCAAYE